MLQANAAEAVGLLKSLANQPRLMVLCALVEREHTVGELEELVGLSQSAVSQHLARLRAENIVTTRRDGQKIYYALEDDRARKIVTALHGIFCRET